MNQKTKFKQTEIGKIPEDWEVRSVEGLYEITSGLSKAREEFGRGYPFLSFMEVFNNFSLPKRLTLLVNSNEKERLFCSIKRGDVFLTRTSETQEELGMSSVALKDYENATFNGFTKRLRPKTDKILPEFAAYLFRSKKIRNQISAFSSLTTRASLNSVMIKKIRLIVPPLSEQRSIAKILSDLDSKIELNKKMNRTLEAIGRAIFNKLFIEERKEDWGEGFLGDKNLTEILGSGIEKFSGEKFYIATADVNNSDIINYNTKINFDNRPSRANMQPIPNSVWFAKMKKSKKTVLFDDFSKLELKNLILSTGFAGLKVKPYALYYIWNIINNNHFEYIKDNLSIGTTMQGVNNELIKQIKLTIPDDFSLKDFNEKVKSFYHIIYLNNIQNQYLTWIRNSILPKLMSGEIRVK